MTPQKSRRSHNKHVSPACPLRCPGSAPNLMLLNSKAYFLVLLSTSTARFRQRNFFVSAPLAHWILFKMACPCSWSATRDILWRSMGYFHCKQLSQLSRSWKFTTKQFISYSLFQPTDGSIHQNNVPVCVIKGITSNLNFKCDIQAVDHLENVFSDSLNCRI